MTRPARKELTESAKLLYGLIHARFICSSRGLDLMVYIYDKFLLSLILFIQRKKYADGHFGVCPRMCCHEQKVVPVRHTLLFHMPLSHQINTDWNERSSSSGKREIILSKLSGCVRLFACKFTYVSSRNILYALTLIHPPILQISTLHISDPHSLQCFS